MKKCIVCGSDLYSSPVLVCKNMPSKSQYLPKAEDLTKDKPIDYRLCQCKGCGLVQLDAEPVSYYLDSTRAGERSAALIKMRREQYKYLIEKYELQGKKLIEIGAGKGGFIKTLLEMTEYNMKAYGLENNANFVDIARENDSIHMLQGNPEDPNIAIKYAPFDVFVSFSYPARLINPNNMLRGISSNLVEEGIGFIQVPSLEHLKRDNGLLNITRDHVAYYSKDSLRFLLTKNGFDVLEEGEAGNVYIYAIVKKRKHIDLRDSWNKVETLSKKVAAYVDKYAKNGDKFGIWCAGHYAFTILSISKIGDKIEYIIDNAEFKQGRFSPVSHVPIVSAEHLKKEPVDRIIILGPLYMDEIVEEIREKCSKEVIIVTIEDNEVIEM